MSTTTITEALAELKTLGKRLGKKRQFVQLHSTRESKLRDPLDKNGGSKTVVTQELQSIGDLEQRVVGIRSAINRCNQDTSLTVGNKTQTVADWLIWKREVMPTHQAFLVSLARGVQSKREEVVYGRRSSQVADDDTDIIVNLDEGQLGSDIEQLEVVLGTLDGQLSLLNATTTIEID